MCTTCLSGFQSFFAIKKNRLTLMFVLSLLFTRLAVMIKKTAGNSKLGQMMSRMINNNDLQLSDDFLSCFSHHRSRLEYLQYTLIPCQYPKLSALLQMIQKHLRHHLILAYHLGAIAWLVPDANVQELLARGFESQRFHCPNHSETLPA